MGDWGWIIGGCALGILVVVACIIIAVCCRKYTMTFDTNGVKFNEAIVAIKARKGQKIYLPVLISPNHEFLGWFYDKACKERFDTDKMVKGNVKLYAGWKKKKVNKPQEQPKTLADGLAQNLAFSVVIDW